ncbi:MAG: hypothetical protein Q4A35_03290 [Candidatus Gracilibacteria bacterium]|nr:hypothetical protein [Candidatus Gracilibacteria bacterium]
MSPPVADLTTRLSTRLFLFLAFFCLRGLQVVKTNTSIPNLTIGMLYAEDNRIIGIFLILSNFQINSLFLEKLL